MFSFKQCSHFSHCSGCELADPVAELLPLREMRSFFEEACLPEVPLHRGKNTEWRIRAKLAIRKDKMGLYKRGTHDVLDIPNCLVHHPAINRAQKLVANAIQSLSLPSYDEREGKGLMRYIQCIVERKTGLVSLTLVVTKNDKSVNDLASMLCEKYRWHSLWMNINPHRDNRIFSENWIHLFGQKHLREEILGVPIYFSPASFGQANLDLFEKLVEEIRDEIPENTDLLEYYAGMGSLSLPLKKKLSSLTCVESNPFARKLFLLSAGDFQASYIIGEAGRNTHLLKNAPVILVDPPRKGLDAPLLLALQQASGLLIYVSCNHTSFIRDAKELLSSGWSIKKASLYLFFPGSPHIETLCFFQKNY